MTLFLLILLSSLFAITHIGMSHGEIRRSLIQKLGEQPFRGLYSLVSFLTLGGAIWVFSGHRNLGPLFWDTPGWLYPLVYLLMLLGLMLLVSSFVTPSPTGMVAKSMTPKGVLRITRHPMNMGFASFGLAHMVANGSLGDLFFFGSIFVVGFFGAYHQDHRLADERGHGFAAFRTQTSVLPFAAILQGRNHLKPEEFRIPVLALILAGYVALVLFHGRLFGAEPF